MAKTVKKKPGKYSNKSMPETLVKEAAAEKYISKRRSSVAEIELSEDELKKTSRKLASLLHQAKDIKIISHSLHAPAILANAANKPERNLTALEKMKIVRIGIGKKDLENFKEKAKLDYDKLARALAVTRATLINKKSEEKFNAVLSERILALADLYSYGFEVFEDEDRFNRWIFTPNKALGGMVPYELIDNQFGRDEVRSIIGRIDYGVYS